MHTVAPCYRTSGGQTIESRDAQALVLGAKSQALKLLSDAPRLSHCRADLMCPVEILDERDERRAVLLPQERPLSVWLDDRELVTLMTLGAAPEWLTVGYLRNQSIIGDLAEIESVQVDWSTATAHVRSAKRVPRHSALKNPWARAGCALGAALGDPLRALEKLELALPSGASISKSTLLSILETMRETDDIHRLAGSVHSCALFGGRDLLLGIEDVSRHNGVDTVTGWMALHGVPGAKHILFTTGRLTGEIVMKAAINGIPILITRNGITNMGYRIAAQLRMTLFGRAVNRRFICYAGAERFDANA